MIFKKINFNELTKIIDKKLFIYLILISLATIIISILELIGIGALAGFVLLLSDVKNFIDSLPNLKILNFVKEMEEKNLINLFLILIVCFFLIKNILIFLFIFSFNKLRVLFNYSISKKLLDTYLSKNFEFFLLNKNSNLIHNIKEETVRFTGFIFSLINILKESILIIALITGIFFINWKITSLTIVLFGFLSIIIFSFIKKRLYNLGKDQTHYSSRLIKKLIETFQDIKLIKVRSLENFFSKKILFNQKKLLDVGFFQATIVSIPRLILEIFAVLGLSLTIFFFIKLNYSFNEILPFITFLALAIVRMVPAIASLNNNINNVTTNLISFEIVTKHFKDKKISDLKNKDSSGKKFLKIDNLEVKNLSYSYLNQPNDVLNDLNFKLSKNDVLGIIGDSGSGKTTLVNIICGLLKPKSGNILINDSVIEEQNLKDYSISYMPQFTNIIDENLDLNIAYGVDEANIDKKKITESLKIAELEKIDKDFYQKQMGEDGLNISGGQKQRIGLARTVYYDPDLLILDEPTSDLDFKTQDKIIENLKLLSKNKITIIIAHRLNTLEICNKLLILESGLKYDFGPKNEILNKNSDLSKFFKNK
tara:strand:- start:27370 stop:29154 length:1785 start_codon:yes stop_codon:yes gene_type:complete